MLKGSRMEGLGVDWGGLHGHWNLGLRQALRWGENGDSPRVFSQWWWG